MYLRNMSFLRLLTGLLAAFLAGAAAASTSRIWFTDEYVGLRDFKTHGYDVASGKILLIVAALGVVCSLAGGWTVRAWPWVTNLLLGLAGVSAVMVAGATYHEHERGYTWTATQWFWVSLGLTIGWSVFAAVVTFIRKPALSRLLEWLRFLLEWLRFRPDPNPARARLTLPFVAAFASSVFMLVGALGPWATTGAATRSGLDDFGDGMIVLGAAFLAALGLLSHLGLGNRRVLPAVLGLAIVAAITSIYDIRDIEPRSDVATGWGINLDAGASVVLGLSTLALVFRRGPSLVAPTPVPSVDGAAAD
jgi:hypothetical protein